MVTWCYRMQQDTGHRWKRKAMHTALGRAHEGDLQSEALASTALALKGCDGQALSPQAPPPRLSPFVGKAAGLVDWAIIHEHIPRARTKSVTLDKWLIQLPEC